MPTIDYEVSLLKDLKKLDYAASYLTEAMNEGVDVFMVALNDVAKANGGMKKLSEKTKLNRENLYDMLSKDGNPRLKSLSLIVNELGFNLKIEKIKRAAGKKTRKLVGKKAA